MNPQAADQLSPAADIISSTLPPFIIDTILCLLPIKEAARTSILSKEWRYKWTKIPKLHFHNKYSSTHHDDHQTMESERDMTGKRCKLFNAIFQVLLTRQAPILELSLHLEVDKTCVELDQILSYLSRNNTISLKKLTLELLDEYDEFYRVPSSLFKFQHLTYLHLSECDLNIQTTPTGFPRLKSLYLKNVYISSKNLLHILSNSPRLKYFILIIARELIIGDVNSTVIELFKCIPMIEQLIVYSGITECFVIEDSDRQELPTSVLIHLKYFYMKLMSSASADDLRFLALLIRSSPNLEIIKLKMYGIGVDGDVNADDDINGYSDIWMEHLNELEIYDFRNLKSDLKLLKFFLAKSPVLKNVHLRFRHALDKNEESEMLKILLRSPPLAASPVVEIIITSKIRVAN